MLEGAERVVCGEGQSSMDCGRGKRTKAVVRVEIGLTVTCSCWMNV